MTPLAKPVQRLTRTRANGKGEPLVIILKPNDTIEIREKGSHTSFEVSIEAVYHLAARLEARSRK